MRKTFTRLISGLLVCLLLAGFCTPRAAAEEVESSTALGVLWDSFTPNDQVFTLSASGRIYIVSDTEPTGDFLQTSQLIQQQFAALPCPMEMVWGPLEWAKAGDICLSIVDNSALGTEGFKLVVTDKAAISANTTEGLIYGSNALIKHLRNIQGATLQGFTAIDVPDTKQRAVSLDCGRKYFTKDWICNFIRQMSWMGYNTLELHFSDDSGFRIDLWDETYYKGQFQPKNDFSWLCGSNCTSWTLSKYQDDIDKGKYLTTAELVEILETANAYHIEVIPAFDSPSHLDYTTWKFEQNYLQNPNYQFYSTYYNKDYHASDFGGVINYTGKSQAWVNQNVYNAKSMHWPYFTTIDITQESAKAFIFELYIDIADFFKEYSGSTNFSIGADEVNLENSYVKWNFSHFPGYINDLNRLLNSKDYTMRMYNDFMGSTKYNAQNYTFDENIQILYWDSPFNPNEGSDDGHTQPVSYFVNQGRTLYNCIQTNTYYALRITKENDEGMDARSRNNTWWTFYHSTEDLIFNEWYPADISEHGRQSEDVPDVPDANLGGAYFLIWCDYACVSTEQDIWDGVADTTKTNPGEWYSLLDRMWSNTIKMWNADINNTVSYDEYAALRARFSYFPGFAACSSPAKLPEAVAPTKAYRADHSALKSALAEKLSSDDYTPKSYVAYSKAYDTALAVDANYAATAEEVAAAVYALHLAKEQLIPMTAVLTVCCKTTVNGSERLIQTLYYPLVVSDYRFHIPAMTGYTYSSCDGCTFTPLAVRDGSGFVIGKAKGATVVTLWYQNTPDASSLDYMIRNAITEKGIYTESSWSAYQRALNNAIKFSMSGSVTQSDINRLISELESAQTGLVTDCAQTKILSVEPLSPVAYQNKQVALRITTTPDVASIKITLDTDSAEVERNEELEHNVTPTLYVGKVQKFTNGETLKVWLVYFPAVDDFTYTITANSATKSVTQNVEITVQ